MNCSFLNLPDRTSKPRETGVTMVIDSGMGLSQVRDTLEISGPFIDYVKLGWGTGAVCEKLEEKIALYREAGVPCCLGGTFFEIAWLQKKVPEFKAMLKTLGLGIVEVSDGSVEMPHEEKLEHIREFSKDFKVLSEYGSKEDVEVRAPSRWVDGMQSELDAGAWKAIAEGRESGTAGMYRNTSELRTGLVDEIVMHISVDNILWEAPQKSQQCWFIKKYGANVNLGNIAASQVIPLETLRLGLRGDTLKHFHA